MKTIFFSLFFISTLLLNTQLYAAAEGISKQQAVSIAKQRHAGRVLAVKLKDNSYQVKMLSDSGKVQVIRVDVESGKIKSSSQAGVPADSRPHR